jgi:hypothetical protein
MKLEAIMGLIKDQFGNVADNESAMEAIMDSIREPAPFTHLDFKGTGITRLG